MINKYQLSVLLVAELRNKAVVSNFIKIIFKKEELNDFYKQKAVNIQNIFGVVQTMKLPIMLILGDTEVVCRLDDFVWQFEDRIPEQSELSLRITSNTG